MSAEIKIHITESQLEYTLVWQTQSFTSRWLVDETGEMVPEVEGLERNRNILPVALMAFLSDIEPEVVAARLACKQLSSMVSPLTPSTDGTPKD